MTYNVTVRSKSGRIELQHRGLTKGTADRYARILRKQVDPGWTVTVEPVLEDNPRRPPKKWWQDCLRGVRESGAAYSPEQVCGSLWYHKMSESQRRAVTKRQERKLDENPLGMLAPLGIVSGIAGAVFWIAKHYNSNRTNIQSGYISFVPK